MSVDFAFIGTSIGFGGVAGFLIGYAVKKAIKIMMIIIGLFFASLAYLNYQGIITINWDKLGSTATDATMGLGKRNGPGSWDFRSGHPHLNKFWNTSHRQFCCSFCAWLHERLIACELN